MEVATGVIREETRLGERRHMERGDPIAAIAQALERLGSRLAPADTTGILTEWSQWLSQKDGSPQMLKGYVQEWVAKLPDKDLTQRKRREVYRRAAE